MKNYLEFEKEIMALEQEVDNLKSPFGSEGISEVDTQKIKNTQDEINEKLRISKTLKIRNDEYLKNLKYDLKVCKNNIKNLLTVDNI